MLLTKYSFCALAALPEFIYQSQMQQNLKDKVNEHKKKARMDNDTTAAVMQVEPLKWNVYKQGLPNSKHRLSP